MNYRKRFDVELGAKVRLGEIAPEFKDNYDVYVVRTFETKYWDKEERNEPSGWDSGDGLLMQSSP